MLYRVLARDPHLYLFCDQETAFIINAIGEDAGFRFWKALIWDKVCAPEVPTGDQPEPFLGRRTHAFVQDPTGEATAEEIRQRLDDPPSVRMVHRFLAKFVDGGRVVRAGKGRSTRYRLAE